MSNNKDNKDDTLSNENKNDKKHSLENDQKENDQKKDIIKKDINPKNKKRRKVEFQSLEFTEGMKILKEKEIVYKNLRDELDKLKRIIKKDTDKLQKICVHRYVREASSDSCYRDYLNICKYCGRIN